MPHRVQNGTKVPNRTGPMPWIRTRRVADSHGMQITAPNCPHARSDDKSCPALRPDGTCVAPSEMSDLVHAAIARAAVAEGVDDSGLDVSLSCTTPGALRLVLRGGHQELPDHTKQRLGVRALAGLCQGARAADTISVCIAPTVPA